MNTDPDNPSSVKVSRTPSYSFQRILNSRLVTEGSKRHLITERGVVRARGVIPTQTDNAIGDIECFLEPIQRGSIVLFTRTENLLTTGKGKIQTHRLMNETGSALGIHLRKFNQRGVIDYLLNRWREKDFVCTPAESRVVPNGIDVTIRVSNMTDIELAALLDDLLPDALVASRASLIALKKGN